ncbi:MAG: hypothetical protein IT162_16500 [Bryobacterales bacterium]|nr:hypothetical protein [Bryobacterales bacterium]
MTGSTNEDFSTPQFLAAERARQWAKAAARTTRTSTSDYSPVAGLAADSENRGVGISIGYQGKLDDLSRLDELVREVKDFCARFQWEYLEIDQHLDGIRFLGLDDWEPGRRKKKTSGPVRSPETHPDEFVMHSSGSLTMWFDQVQPRLMEETMRGIYCYPPGTDSVNLTFDGSGNLCCFQELGDHIVRGKFRNLKHYIFNRPFTKTTGCVEEHKRICALLRIIQQKYIPNLQVNDPTGYYESEDVKRLERESMGLAAAIGMLRRDSGLLKSLLDIPNDADLTDVTDEFNQSPRGSAAKQKARGVDGKQPKPRPN